MQLLNCSICLFGFLGMSKLSILVPGLVELAESGADWVMGTETCTVVVVTAVGDDACL